MARYKNTDYNQTLLIPVTFSKQIIPGTLEYTINYVIDHHIDLSIFENDYTNDEFGAPAYNPAILFKIILLAYSRGIYSSRRIANACQENIIFKALSCDSQPDFTTISLFIRNMDDKIITVFSDILFLCHEMNLIGGEIFALDGCKFSSNASKEWSGTFKDLEKKRDKFKETIKLLRKKHRENDDSENKTSRSKDMIKKSIRKLQKHVKKIDTFLENNEPKPKSRHGERQSNITDNESAKMKTSHGVIQGYNGIAITDDKHQVIMYSEAFGSGSETGLMKPFLKKAVDIIEKAGIRKSFLSDKILIADTGSFSEENLKYLSEENINAYIPDQHFRKRDSRFDERDQHRKKKEERFQTKEFIFDDENNRFICPTGKYLKYEKNQKLKNSEGRFYRSRSKDCRVCKKKDKCLKSEKSKHRSIYVIDNFFDRNHSEEMMKKIDTAYGRDMYSRRMGIIEPVFGNIRNAKGLNRFTLRTKKKVNIQWVLYCMVHNVEKITNYGNLQVEL